MISDLAINPIAFIFSFVSLIIAIAFHEFSHAFMADRLGDPTPSLQGRLTLNPLAHIDPLGLVLLLFFRFGWGKPVQFDPFNLRNPRRDAALISLAGPVSNLILASVASIIMRILINVPFSAETSTGVAIILNLVLSFLVSLISMNVILCVFNLLPIHPLDGFKIVGGLLSREQARQWYELEKYGMLFLIILLLPLAGGVSPISQLIGPPIQLLLHIFLPSTP